MNTTTTIRPIMNDQDLAEAHAAIRGLCDRQLDEREQAELDALVTLADAYERKRHPTRERDPIEVLHGAIEHAGQDRDELAALFGSKAIADKVMARELPLTLEMIHAVSDAWGIPLAMLTRKSAGGPVRLRSYVVEKPINERGAIRPVIPDVGSIG